MKDWKLVLVGGGIALAGMIVGASIFGAHPAAAQRTYTRFFAMQDEVGVSRESVVATPGPNRLINVPSGWDVVSAGGTGADAVVMFCH